jgi:lambda repressor-like predicted transcriptional regulator
MSTDLLLSLRQRGKTVGAIASNLNVHRQCVYDALKGRGSRRCRVAIALVIGVPPSHLFPQLSFDAKAYDDCDYYRFKELNSSAVSS